MGADGSHGPKPWVQRQARTAFLRVPNADWINVTRGVKREFRAGSGACSALWSVEPPMPVVAYRVHKVHGYEAKLMILVRKWQEPLGAISAASLEAEGFESLAEFRRYWMGREKRRFTPTRMVMAYRVRPWEPEDKADMAELLLYRLYEDFLP